MPEENIDKKVEFNLNDEKENIINQQTRSGWKKLRFNYNNALKIEILTKKHC